MSEAVVAHRAVSLDAEKLIESEYGFLREEVAESLKESANLEKLAAGASGAVWAWLFTQKQPVPSLAWAIPIVFVALGGMRSWTLYESVKMIARYMKDREKDVSAFRPERAGWETYRGPKTAGVFITALTFWLILFGLSVYGWLCPPR